MEKLHSRSQSNRRDIYIGVIALLVIAADQITKYLIKTYIAYGNVWRAQQEEYDGHVLGTELHNPDFVQFAQSFGIPAWRAQSADDLATALRQALDAGTPALVEVPVGPMRRVF